MATANPRKTIKFIIIGAGPGGIASASTIQRHLMTLPPFDGSDPNLPKIEYELFDQKAHVGESVGVQYSLALGNRERWDAVFGPAGMNIRDRVDPLISPLRHVKYVFGDGEPIWSRDIPQGTDGGKYIGQAKRAPLLEAMVNSLPKEKVQYRKRISKWRQWEENGGGVEITFEDGYIARGDYIIAADGVWSFFRMHFVPNSQPITTDIGSIYLLAKIPKDTNDPLTNKLRDMVNVDEPWEEANLPAGQTLEDTPFDQLRDIGIRMCKEEHYASPELELAFRYAVKSDFTVWRLKHLQDVPYSHFGRILMIGDAVHAMIPYIGRGAVTAIEDGALIGPSIRAGLLKGETIPQIFKKYADARLPATKAIWSLAMREKDNWWEIGARRRDKNLLVMAEMDRGRKAKEEKGRQSKARI
ncbi:hypothetical protein HDU93_006131 [Gonapodya sp. JEL0774]|nr:hypothetical protein HDU93_006131 [Gonapodya sp. JEL0774]